MKLTMLGSGTSSGVPRIGNDWGACDPHEPKNRRTRVSILVESATTRILVDTSPDMRAQLLSADVVHIDAIMWTHDHADHSHGLDDVRQLYHHRGTPVPGYARAQTLTLLKQRFAYAFDPGALAPGKTGRYVVAATTPSLRPICLICSSRTPSSRSCTYSTLFASMVSPTLMSWKPANIMPHS